METNKLLLSLLSAALMAVISLGVASADQFPGASGMAFLDDTHMLIVQDVKIGQPGSPLGVLMIDPKGGYDYVELEVDWPERQANDLESCFALPDRPGEFLVAESGSYHEVWNDPTTELYAGRIYHIRVQPVDEGWDVEVLQTMPIPLELHEVEGMVATPWKAMGFLTVHGSSSSNNAGNRDYDSEYRQEGQWIRKPSFIEPSVDVTVEKTPEAKPGVPGNPVAYNVDQAVAEVEENSADKKPDRFFIVLATRGGETLYEPARLHWGVADLASGEYTFQPEDNLPLYNPQMTPAASERGCSDLYLDEVGVIWVAAAYDLGDAGPFRSAIYRFGELDAVLQSEDSLLPAYSMLHVGMPPVSWEIEGLKIEALSAPMIEGSVMSYATDDEDYGGIWRSLAEAR